ncbi:MAG: hypothetical protein GXY27_02380 [Erysipelotrichaceae bacterium]|jgi:hypothetical protein|nr:hypothetical protein [Erysipelotrichaceae bacterium]
MILYKGEIFSDEKQEQLISSLKEEMFLTLAKNERPTFDMVIDACDKLYKRVISHEFDQVALPLLASLSIPFSALERYARSFSKQELLKKIEIELGELRYGELPLDEHNVRFIEPLGILFHIAAGNVDLLPAYSVIEGLLVGNINILKLPTGDSGLSVLFLNELIKEQPKLKDYIYVFDVPSTETKTIKTLASFADAVIVWGGEEAVRAVRQLVDINATIIEWGHKMSFSYVDMNVKDDELEALCQSVCISNQLFCSSSQGIYVNTDSDTDLHLLANRLLPIFVKVSKKINTLPLTMKAKNTLLLYNEKLEGNLNNIYADSGVSIIVKEDQKLELSMLFQNLWIKALKIEDIVKVLKPNKRYLQTASINLNIAEKEVVCRNLVTAGVTRIVALGDNSRMISGESHDGEYPLRRYAKIVEKIK